MNNIDNAIYLVPTPIGNLDDLTKRAFQILNKVDIIACEDTRNSGILFKNLKIFPKQLISYHEHNETSKSDDIIRFVKNGKSVAIISDAGSPGISDPGRIIVKKAIENDIKIIPLPGASAIIPALTASGLIENEFIFAGFPPNKKGRVSFLEKYKYFDIPIIFYESPNRLLKFTEEISDIYGNNSQICIAREISKIHEEFIRGNISDVLQNLKNRENIKGEIVVILKPKKEN